MIPQWYLANYRLAYRNKFGIPGVRPKYDIGLDCWWVN
jgi:microcin C transport system substrate-binding protein